MVNTNLSRWYPQWQLVLSYPLRYLFLRSCDEGADSVVYAACAKDLSTVNGKYFADRKPIFPSSCASSEKIAQDVYNKSIKLIEGIVKSNDSH
jgi:hypothetical protein